MKEQRVSGNIWAEPESIQKEGEVYIVRDKWGRTLANRIEEKRSK